MRVLTALVLASLAHTTAAAAPTRKASASHQPASPARHEIPASGVLGGSDLVSIARLHISGGADQFSDDPTLAYIGREFTVTVNSDDLSADYNKETHALSVSTPTYSDGFKLADDIHVSHFVGQNGYGARAAVTKREGNIFGVWIPGESYNRKPITYTTILDGPAARDLSKSIKLRLSGVITRADGIYAEKDSAVFKKLLYADATVSDPYELFVVQYFVSARFTKAEWIDGRSGDVLASQELLANNGR